jgi:hypothetical protein
LADYETFSRRQKALNRTTEDVFIYDDLPEPLRVQAIGIWKNFLRAVHLPSAVPENIYEYFHIRISTELGVFELPSFIMTRSHSQAIIDYFIGAEVGNALDVLEMLFAFALPILSSFRGDHYRDERRKMLEKAISQLNRRLLQHSVGYALLDSHTPQLVRRDNEHLHSEATIPALTLLSEQGFDGANDEYRKAHEHYRHGRQKECLNECLKAFESTMKTICSRKGWTIQPKDTAKNLIAVCITNGLFPTFLESHIGNLRSALESSIPTVRNKMGGHGQGEEPTSVPGYYAEYLLHETAVTIVFLVEASKALP